MATVVVQHKQEKKGFMTTREQVLVHSVENMFDKVT